MQLLMVMEVIVYSVIMIFGKLHSSVSADKPIDHAVCIVNDNVHLLTTTILQLLYVSTCVIQNSQLLSADAN